MAKKNKHPRGEGPVQVRNAATAAPPRPSPAPNSQLPTPREARDMHSTGMQLRAATIDEEARSVEAVISTENPVRVLDWSEYRILDEVLRVDGMESPGQVPMLNSHWRFDNDDVFGSVRDIRAEGESVVARLHFADVGDERIDRTWNKVRQGHLTDVSVGYRVLERTDIKPYKSATVGGKKYTAGERTLRVATRWRLLEVSPTPIGADQAAKFRGDSYPQEEIPMNPKLRAYLVELGLRADASDEEAAAFRAGLKGGQAQKARRIEDEIRAAESGEGEGQRNEPSADPPQPAEPGRQAPPANPPAPTPEQVAAEAVATERRRQIALRNLAGADVPAEVLQRALDEGWDESRAAGEFLTAVRSNRQPPIDGAPAGHVRGGPASARAIAAGLISSAGLDPLRARMHGGREEPSRRDLLTEQDADLGDRFRGLSAVDLCRLCADADGVRYNPHDYEDCYRAAVSGATFNNVFSTNVYARLIEGFQTTPDSTAGWCDEEDVPNFLQQEDISMEANASLELLPRGDTAKHATASDSKETYKIARYAKQFVIDEQDIIDDRLGALLRMPQEMGEAARKLRPNLVYALMLENPTLNADSVAVFADGSRTVTYGGTKVDQDNLITDALANTALRTAISNMGKMRDSNGNVLLLRPRFLIVPAALEWQARELTTSAALAKIFADSADPWYTTENLLAREQLTVVVDDRIGANGVIDPRSKAVRTGLDTNWFLAAGGSKSLRVAYRRGTGRAPQLRRFELSKGQWGVGWDIKMDIGAAFMDYRTFVKSTGAG
jgi:hypothetical protein